MSMEARILSLHERIAILERFIRACQNSTGWDDAIKDAIIRRDRMFEEHKAMKTEEVLPLANTLTAGRCHCV
jgi:hypothetical protein